MSIESSNLVVKMRPSTDGVKSNNMVSLENLTTTEGEKKKDKGETKHEETLQ